MYRTAPILPSSVSIQPSMSICIPGIRHQRRQHLLRYEGPSLCPYCMCKYSRRGHPPRPLGLRRDVRVDSPRIAHVVYPASEEGLYRGSEVEGHHTRCYRAHTSGLHSCCWSLIRLLRRVGGVIAAGPGLGRHDSSVYTGAGRHRISWEVFGVCSICGLSVVVYIVEDVARGSVTSDAVPKFSEKHQAAAGGHARTKNNERDRVVSFRLASELQQISGMNGPRRF